MTGFLGRLGAVMYNLPVFSVSALKTLRSALRDYARALDDSGQPGAAAFPKAVFELDRTQTPLSGRSPTAYFELARALWAREWKSARDEAGKAIWLRRLHEDVMLAHQLELEAIERMARRP